MMVNWFDALSKRLLNELILLVKCAQKVLFAPAKGHGSTRITGKQFTVREVRVILIEFLSTINRVPADLA